MTKKRWFRWLQWIVLVYTVIGAALYFLQDRILFHPVTLKRDHQFDFQQPHRDISVPVNQEDTINVVDFSAAGNQRRGIVLYFHGNKKNISWYARYMPYFTRQGYEVLMIDYPGYGKSTGKLTEKKLYAWAREVYRMAMTKFPADSIIIYGKSMGTGIAAQLAAGHDCKRLILETPYYDFPSVVSHYFFMYPVKWMLHYQLPTYQYIQTVRAPISIFHGTDDWIVSYRNTKRLQPFLKPGDEVITIEGGSHNDLYDYPLTVKKLDSLLVH